MHDLFELKSSFWEGIDTFRCFHAPYLQDLFGGLKSDYASQAGSGTTLRIEEPQPKFASTIKEGGEGRSSGSRTSTGKVENMRTSKDLIPLVSNQIYLFFNLHRTKYPGQRLDKKLDLQHLAIREKKSYRDVYHHLWQLVESTEGVTPTLSIQHWYSILDFKLKDLVRAQVLRLSIDKHATLEFVLRITKAISINLVRKKATISVTKASKTEKLQSTATTVARAHIAQSSEATAAAKKPRENYCSNCG